MDIVRRLDEMDKKTKTMGITAADRKEQKELREQLKRVMIQEEIKLQDGMSSSMPDLKMST